MRLALAIVLATAAFAQAQPAPAPVPAGKRDAKELVASAVKLLDAHDYRAALALFKEAYQSFPSAKILLDIGTTQKLLDHKADAANAYQRYLDSPDADAARRKEVSDVIADLDKSLAKLELAVTPPDAELEVGDEWLPAAAVKLLRVDPGRVTLHARRDGYTALSRTLTVAAASDTPVQLDLTPIAKPAPIPVVVAAPRAELVEAARPEGPRSRFGAIAVAHVSVVPKVGSAWLVGATADVLPQLSIDAAFLLGPGLVSSGMTTIPPAKYGGYLGASYALLAGPWRPRVSVGMPVFASNGARFALRGAAGVEYVASRHASFVLELGVEQNLNPETDIDNTAFVPAIAAVGRL
ncbi:MAG TPA: hypothetical protein VLX92_28480 [Kofleriaceae bacterium]|nr:hypothetical protein [Kofleriaceae bacterium]